MIRTDHPDVVYRSEQEKFDAVVEELEARIRSILQGHGEQREQA